MTLDRRDRPQPGGAEADAGLPFDPGLPPWLAYWTVAFLASLPALWAVWRTNWDDLAAMAASAEGLGRLILYPAQWYDMLPPLVLLVGLAAALCAPLRAAYVERRYRLQAPPALPALGEIQAWVQERAPRVALRANVLRANPVAFVYLGRGGRPYLAVFGGLVRLWRADRAAAEAVLDHELAHCRRGDVWLAGVGSPFEALVRLAPAAYLALVLLPLLAELGVQTAAAARELAAVGGGAGRVWGAQAVRLATSVLPTLIANALGQALQLFTPLVLPVAALWAAEFNADRAAALEDERREVLARALGLATEGRSWWRRLRLRLSHPPAGWRRAAVANASPWGLLALLGLYPLAAVARLLLLHGRAMLAYVAAGVGNLGPRMAANTVAWLATQAGPWTIMALLTAAWPWLAPLWERLWGGRRANLAETRGPRWPYLAAAAAMGVVAAAGWAVR